MATKKMIAPRSIGRALNFATGRLNALCEQMLDPHGISLPQWVILSCLWREGDLPVSALADLVGAGLPATSRLVDRMAARGLVVRRKHENDGRVMVVSVTEKGNQLRHLSDFHERINETLFEGFSEQERALAFSLLERMQHNAQSALNAGSEAR